MSYFFFYFLIGRFTIKMVDSTLSFDRVVKYSTHDFAFFQKKTKIVYFDDLSKSEYLTLSAKIVYFQF